MVNWSYVVTVAGLYAILFFIHHHINQRINQESDTPRMPADHQSLPTIQNQSVVRLNSHSSEGQRDGASRFDADSDDDCSSRFLTRRRLHESGASAASQGDHNNHSDRGPCAQPPYYDNDCAGSGHSTATSSSRRQIFGERNGARPLDYEGTVLNPSASTRRAPDFEPATSDRQAADATETEDAPVDDSSHGSATNSRQSVRGRAVQRLLILLIIAAFLLYLMLILVEHSRRRRYNGDGGGGRGD